MTKWDGNQRAINNWWMHEQTKRQDRLSNWLDVSDKLKRTLTVTICGTVHTLQSDMLTAGHPTQQFPQMWPKSKLRKQGSTTDSQNMDKNTNIYQSAKFMWKLDIFLKVDFYLKSISSKINQTLLTGISLSGKIYLDFLFFWARLETNTIYTLLWSLIQSALWNYNASVKALKELNKELFTNKIN